MLRVIEYDALRIAQNGAKLALMFELRLEGGKRYFWSPVPTVFGHLRVLGVPEFCTQAGFQGRCGEGTCGIWDAWPIDDNARFQHLHPDRNLCRPVEISARTPGVALVSFAHKTEQADEALWVQLFLSTTEPAQNGQSVFEDWVKILRAATEDLNNDTVLRLDFPHLSPAEIDGFKSQRRLATTSLALEVRPRPVQWARDD
jgi:hypothetical protein